MGRAAGACLLQVWGPRPVLRAVRAACLARRTQLTLMLARTINIGDYVGLVFAMDSVGLSVLSDWCAAA
jgi:hypothetical protein